jgi:predicted DCC family thiol-disulfide oxidoreductase YuxK
MNGPRQIRVLCDGDFPLCSREIRFLDKRDRARGRIEFEDIAEPSSALESESLGSGT